MNRKKYFAVSLVILILTIGVVGCDTLAPPATTKAATGGAVLSQQSTGIWVTGEGKVTAVPDVAMLNLGVEIQDATVAEAQAKASTAMDAVSRALDSFEIARNDIQTRQFSIYPVRQVARDTGQEVLVGYRVTNTITVKVRRVGSTGQVIDAVAQAGGDAIRINSIGFTVEDPTVYLKDAREKAMADASSKAKQLASLAGVRLGDPTYVNESGGYIPPPPIPYRTEAGMPAPAPPVTSISSGETEVRLTVQVVYGIR